MTDKIEMRIKCMDSDTLWFAYNVRLRHQDSVSDDDWDMYLYLKHQYKAEGNTLFDEPYWETYYIDKDKLISNRKERLPMQ